MKKIILILLGSGLCGCTSLSVFQPTVMNEIPEISSGTNLSSFDFGWTSGYNYTSTTDASRRPPLWDSSIKNDTSPSARARFPVGKIPAEIIGGIFITGALVMFKYQFLGPTINNAKKGDVSLAFLLQGSTSSTSTKSGDQNGLFGSGGNHWEAKISSNSLDTSLLLGVRALDSLLLYTGGLASLSTVESKINQDRSTDGLSAGGHYEAGAHIQRSGPVLGLLFSMNQRVSLHIEGNYLSSNISEPGISLPAATNATASLRFDLN